MLQLFNTTAFSWSPDIIDVANAHTIGENFTPSFIPRHTRINRGDIIRPDGGPTLKVTIPIWPEHLWLERQRRRTEKNYMQYLWVGYEYAINNIDPA